MQEMEIRTLVDMQRAWFERGETLPITARTTALERLREAIKQRESDICTALYADLGKSAAESYMTEIGLVLSETTYMLRHIRRLAGEHTVLTPLAHFAARSFVKPSPLGVVLVMSPWNYPFLLSMEPLIDALAAGNTVVVKPSANAPETSRIIAELVRYCFLPQQAAVVEGGRAENQYLLRQRFDHIFFTGSHRVGQEVLRCAAEHMTPVTLELGGKSPVIVDATANINLAARRIVFGKLLNCGQTCVAPDYVLAENSIYEPLIDAICLEIQQQYGQRPLANPDYGRIVNEKHFARLIALMAGSTIAIGGGSDPQTLRISPTVLADVDWTKPVMQEEIFGPILPVLRVSSVEEAIRVVNDHPHPLALYMFSQNKQAIAQVKERCQFGGGCINDTVIHLASSRMGFGGVGDSGMGAYHGKRGFENFSHHKSMVDRKTWIDPPMRYQPYTAIKNRIIRLFLH